jgi:polar amino acid transport system substrate-binding protein
MKQQFTSLFFTSIAIVSVISCWQNLASAGTLKEIQQRRKLVVAVKDNTPPLGFRDRNGNLQGLEIDIARKLATEIFSKSDAIELIPVLNQNRLKVVIDGTVDITIARVTITPNRSRVIDFSSSYYADGTGIITSQSNISKNRDLVGKKVAVLERSSTIASLQYIIPEAQLVGVNSYQQARDFLAAGKVAAIAADRSLLVGWVSANPNYRLLPDKLSAEALGIVLPKGTKYMPLLDLINRSIASWQASGWLDERIRYWGLK